MINKPPALLVAVFAVGAYCAGYCGDPASQIFVVTTLAFAMTFIQFRLEFGSYMVVIPIGHYIIPSLINGILCSVVYGIGFAVQTII